VDSPSSSARLFDIVEAIEIVRTEVANITLDDFEADRRKRLPVERGIEIISEASRHLPEVLKAIIPIFRGGGLRGSETSSGTTTHGWQPMFFGT
jgi:uncharacterized protein with HEPN domain